MTNLLASPELLIPAPTYCPLCSPQGPLGPRSCMSHARSPAVGAVLSRQPWSSILTPPPEHKVLPLLYSSWPVPRPGLLPILEVPGQQWSIYKKTYLSVTPERTSALSAPPFFFLIVLVFELRSSRLLRQEFYHLSHSASCSSFFNASQFLPIAGLEDWCYSQAQVRK
jgi:hypothetical protein